MQDDAAPPLADIGSLLSRLARHVPPRRKRQLAAVMALIVVSGLAEIVSLSAVVPFLGVLSEPGRIVRFAAVRYLMRIFDVVGTQQLILLMAGSFAAAALVSAGLRMLLLWIATRVSFAVGADFSGEAYRRTLYQPYQVHVMRNSSELISAITVKVAEAITVLNALLMLLNSGVVLIFITVALFLLNPFVASSAIIAFGSCYLLIMRAARQRLRVSSHATSLGHTALIKAVQEGIGGIRDVQLDGSQSVYIEIFKKADHSLRRAVGTIVFISNSPRFAMEAIGMVLIAALAVIVSSTQGRSASALPILGALAFGAQRLLPAMQQAYGAWATIGGSQTALATTLELLEQPIDAAALLPPPVPLAFQDAVCLDSIRFRYSDSGPWILENCSITIRKGSRTGIVGASGSGKSTTLDLLMGLLTPTEGQLVVDGLAVTGVRVRAWQRAIAHVPQSIFLADASLAQNIAFGVPPADIDRDRMRLAASRAQIAEFIGSRPEAYDAVVGERGIRLSGGQRQRIGIARALYKRASVLVFDEATSALDSSTERLVMDAIEGLDRDLTIIVIAHRLSTVRHCDSIVELDNGRVVAQGTYEQLLQNSASFRNLASTLTEKA